MSDTPCVKYICEREYESWLNSSSNSCYHFFFDE